MQAASRRASRHMSVSRLGCQLNCILALWCGCRACKQMKVLHLIAVQGRFLQQLIVLARSNCRPWQHAWQAGSVLVAHKRRHETIIQALLLSLTVILLEARNRPTSQQIMARHARIWISALTCCRDCS